MSNKVIVSRDIVAGTLRQLADVGQKQRECVVLWLGRREPNGICVYERYLPQQTAARDMFSIPAPSMRKILERLGQQNLMIAAQIHSHPREAFHSAADDRWAIVRHVDALSIVVPDFAATTRLENFLSLAAVFKLDRDNRWRPVTGPAISTWLQIQ